MPQTHTPEIAFDPYPEQAAVLGSDARIRVVAAGRRSGKTKLAAVDMVRRAFRGGDNWLGWWVTPGNDIAETGFRLIDAALPDVVVARRKQSPPREIELANGARVAFRTADGDPNVSVGLDFVVIDEAGKDFPKRVWTQDLRPTLSDTGGDALFISTPEGRDWFHDYFQRGRSDDYPDVASWQWSTYRNPYVPDDEVDAAKAELPDRIFRQEYLAEFVDDSGGVFPAADAAVAYDLPDGVEPHPMAVGPYRVAADLARHEDYCAIGSLDRYGAVAHLTRERGLSWNQIADRVAAVAAAHGDAPVAIDATRDNKIVADLEGMGVDVRPVTFSAQRKTTLIENLAAAMEAGEITIPADSILETELAVFEYEFTRGGNVRYGAPEGHHDDTVDMLAMANDLPVRSGTPTATIDFGGGGDSATGDEAFEESVIGQAVAKFNRQNDDTRPY